MDNVLNAAFIGCGAIAQKKHLPISASDPNIHIKALYNPSISASEKCKSLFGSNDTDIVTSPDEIFERDDIDLVFIGSPNESHARYTISALKAGKHVICEKPMAISGSDARKMLETSVEAGKLLHISFQNRYSDQALYAKKIIESSACGEIYYSKAYALRRRACPNWGRTLNKAAQGGGPLIDIGSHAIDLALFLADNFDPLYVVGNTYNKLAKIGSDANYWGPWNPYANEVEDSAFGFVTMKNGMTLQIESSFALNLSEEKEASCGIYGTKGGIEVGRDKDVKFIHELCGKMCITTNKLQETERSLTPDALKGSPSEREHSAFMQLLLNGDTVDPAAKQACVVAEIVDAIYQSSEMKQPVYL